MSEPLLAGEADEGSAAAGQAGSAAAEPAPWNQRNAVSYAAHMAWEQIRTVTPIALFLIGYKWLVLESAPTDSLSLFGGVVCVVAGLAVFMEGLKSGMMPLGEAVGMEMGKHLGQLGQLLLAFALGILVTMAEPAIATLRNAGSLVHPDPGDGAPFLYATVNLWSAFYLPAVIGAGVGLACTTGILRSLLKWRMKTIIFVLAPITLTLTLYIRFVADEEIRDILGLAWDCGAVTTGPVTVPLVLALGVGASADNRGGGGSEGESDDSRQEGDDEEEGSWASAFGVVTLASLFPVIMVLLFGVVAHMLTDTDTILDDACIAAANDPALAPQNRTVQQQHHCPPGVSPDASDAGSDSSDGGSFLGLMGDQTISGLRAVCPLVLFLVGVLQFVLHANLPTVNLPDPLNLDAAAPKSNTVVHVSWGALAALLGIIIFFVGLQTGLIVLGSSVGNILPSAFTQIDKTPGKSGDDSAGEPAIYCEADDKNCVEGVALVAMFAWFLGFGATCAEPALNTLGLTVERLTNGQFKRTMLIGAVSFGVATGITVGVLRLIYNFDLMWILLPGYATALVLTAFSSEEYICVAWDSAGVTTGPITVPLVVSMGLGISDALKIKDGFGILACASVSPIISVLAMGLWVSGLGDACSKTTVERKSGSTAPGGASAQDRISNLQVDGGWVDSEGAGSRGQPAADVPRAATAGVPNAAHKLRQAASTGDEACVKAELAAGAVDVDEPDAGGQTALYIAANLGNAAIVRLLIQGAADVNKVNKQTRFTPLMAAALCGHDEVVQTLLDAGADAAATNKRGKTALDLAKAGRFESVCALFPAPTAAPESTAVPAGVSASPAPVLHRGHYTIDTGFARSTGRPVSPSRQRQSAQFDA